jgi:hypothetical protein
MNATKEMTKPDQRVRIDWSKADWKQHDVVLSEQFDCSREAVRQARRRNDPEYRAAVRDVRSVFKAQKKKLREEGRYDESARLLWRQEYRAAMNLLTKEYPGVKPQGYLRRGDTAEEKLRDVDTTKMTLEQVAKKAGCGAQRALAVLRGLGKTYRKLPKGNAKYRWNRFPKNWKELTDKEIGKLVGCTNAAIVTQWRNRHGYLKG